MDKANKENLCKALKITYYCPYLNKELSKAVSKLAIYGHTTAEFQGGWSSGYVRMSVNCKCGRTHEIELSNY